MDKPAVLVVEDEFLIREVLERALEEGGFAVTGVGDADQAEAALRSGQVFQGLVTDVRLPGGRTGWEIAKAARAQFAHIAVVYATGHGELEWPVDGVPGSALVNKPYAPAQVLAALAAQLNIPG